MKADYKIRSINKALVRTASISILLVLTEFHCFSQELPCKSYYSKEHGGRCKERYLEDSNGEIHGKYISYNEDGNVQSRGNYIHGNRDGSWYDTDGWFRYYWYESGNLLATSDKQINSHAEAIAIVKVENENANRLFNSDPCKFIQMYPFDQRREKAKQICDTIGSAAQQKKYVAEKNNLRESSMWTEAVKKSNDEMNTVYLKNYLIEYPDSRNAPMAKAQIQKIETMKPDNEAFRHASQSNSIEGYNQYLKDFPNGNHKREAEVSIAKINQQEQDYVLNNFPNVLGEIKKNISSNSKTGFENSRMQCQRVLNQESSVDNSRILSVSLYMILSQWGLGDIEGARNTYIKYSNSVISFSDGTHEPYPKYFQTFYKKYKDLITLPDGKTNFKMITSKN